jgi:hypothetical protein
MSMSRLDDLVMWLGKEGAEAGLEKSDLTIAEIVDLEPSLSTARLAKVKRSEVISMAVSAARGRLIKSADELMEMDADSLRDYFINIKASHSEILNLLQKMDIRPGSAAKKNLADFAAREISDIGMYRRVAGSSQKTY